MNNLATDVIWIMGWKRDTLIRWLWFLALLVVSIFQSNSVMWSHLKCLSHVEFRPRQSDSQILHFAFISAPCKTLFCDYGGGW